MVRACGWVWDFFEGGEEQGWGFGRGGLGGGL